VPNSHCVGKKTIRLQKTHKKKRHLYHAGEILIKKEYEKREKEKEKEREKGKKEKGKER
jgi:hypothetical protein